MIIALGSDHGGFHTKQEIIKWIKQEKIASHMDFGTRTDDSCDIQTLPKQYATM